MLVPDEDNQYVRARTPESFDRLVQNLEDNDSVLFESIRLSKVGSLPIVPPDSDDTDDTDDVESLKQQIRELLTMNKKKDELIAAKDEQIATLRREIAARQGAPARPMTSQVKRVTDPDLEYYKNLCEATVFQYEKLLEVLSVDTRRSQPIKR